MVTSMHTLISKLKVYFEKQPNQWKKIMTTLNELSSEEGVSMATIKQRFLPLLKGNPLLIDWFMQLFPTERPADPRDDEFEEVQTKKNELPFEEIPASLILAETGDSSSAGCAIKYSQGRIQYGNRYILPADLSFLATSYELKEKVSKSVGERSSSRRGKRANRQQQEEPQEVLEGPQVLTVESPNRHPMGCVHALGPAWDFQRDDTVEEGGSSNSSSANNNNNNNSSTITAKELIEPLCDAATLRAHMNRLNPALGADANNTNTTTTDDAKVSPKKAVVEWKTKPINKRKTIAVVSPKKGSNSRTMGSEANKTTEGSSRSKRLSTRTTTEEKKKEAEKVEPKEECPSDQEGSESQEWTREEDKILLEAINGQEDKTEDQILDDLVLAIPGRWRTEINTRFQFLINVLKKFS